VSRKRIVIIVVAAVAFFLGAITLFVLINGDRFKSFALESMNEKLSTELSVEEMGLSVWAEFPMVTVNLKKVVLMGSVSHSGATADTLIRANSLGVALSLWDVLFGEPKIDALVLEDGVINVRELKNGTIKEYQLNPEDYGIKLACPLTLQGGTPADNAHLIRSVFEGTEQGAPRDIVALNAAAGILVSGRSKNWNDAVKLAFDTIASGKASDKLKMLVKVSND